MYICINKFLHWLTGLRVGKFGCGERAGRFRWHTACRCRLPSPCPPLLAWRPRAVAEPRGGLRAVPRRDALPAALCPAGGPASHRGPRRHLHPAPYASRTHSPPLLLPRYRVPTRPVWWLALVLYGSLDRGVASDHCHPAHRRRGGGYAAAVRWSRSGGCAALRLVVSACGVIGASGLGQPAADVFPSWRIQSCSGGFSHLSSQTLIQTCGAPHETVIDFGMGMDE